MDLQTINQILIDNIPVGWRFYTADCSILNRCSVLLQRSPDFMERWRQMDDENSMLVKIYASGTGINLAYALEEAIKDANNT